MKSQAHAEIWGKSAEMTPLWWLLALLLALVILASVDASRNKRKKNMIDGYLHDTTKPENARRAGLAAYLSKDGFQIVAQDKGLLQVKKDKPGFSLFLFIILALLYVFPAVIYLVWYWTQKPILKTYLIDA